MEVYLQFEYTGEQTELERIFGGYHHINVFGSIIKGDADRLLRLINNAGVPPYTTVYINSAGGDVEEGIKLGCVIRAFDMDTSIGMYTLSSKCDDDPIAYRIFNAGRCFSAATLMYAGGRLRHYPEGTKFGVHRFAYRNPLLEDIERSQELSAGIAKFLEKMGVSLEFLNLSASTASNQLHELNEKQLRKFRMVTGGMTEVTWGTEMQDNILYVRGTRNSIYGLHKVGLAYESGSGFKFFAIIEAQGRQKELCGFGIVEIVLNVESCRIDISQRCSRQENNIDVILASKITNAEARQIAYSNSFGVQIRFSKEAEVFLGVSAMDTSGGLKSLRSLYEVMTLHNID